MKYFRILVKTPLLLTTILIFFILGLFNKVLFFYSKKIRQTLAQRNTQWACFLCLKIFNIHTSYKINSRPTGCLLISNHISFSDILVIASKIPTLFVTSLELKRTPFLGWITQIGECLYVNRISHKDMDKEITNIQTTLKNGFNVLIFPEATTSDAQKIMPYKSSLFKLADNSKTEIVNYCLQYTHANNFELKGAEKSLMSWSNNKSFFKHALYLMSLKSSSASLKEIENVISTDYTSRKELALHLYQSATDAYNNA